MVEVEAAVGSGLIRSLFNRKEAPANSPLSPSSRCMTARVFVLANAELSFWRKSCLKQVMGVGADCCCELTGKRFLGAGRFAQPRHGGRWVGIAQR